MNPTDKRNRRRNGLTRREFLTRPFVEIAHTQETAEPENVIPCRLPLSALKDVPEAVLMQMTPILRQGWTVRFCGTSVAYNGDNGKEGSVPLGPNGCAAAQLFDGTRTLAQVAELLEGEWGQNAASRAAAVREAFLALAMAEVYHPNAPPGTPPAVPLRETEHA
jgi:hypothetical protein